MPRVSDYAEAPYGGISQAAATVRLTTQAEVLEDTAVDIPDGAQPRAPWEFLGKVPDLDADINVVSGGIQKGNDRFRLLLIDDGVDITPRLFQETADVDYELEEVAITVTPDALAYINTTPATAVSSFALLTVEDYTFILNREVTVAIEESSPGVPAVHPSRPHEAILWVRQAGYAREYTIKVTPSGGGTTTVSLRTPNGKDATDGNFVDTDVITAGLLSGSYPVGTGSADAIANGATASGNLNSLTGAGFTVSSAGGVIYLSHPSTNFTVEADDGQGGTALLVVKDKVQAFSDLPKKSPVSGFKVKITQQSGAEEDDFYVQFVETAGPGTGVWEECIGPGAQKGINPETLPVGLRFASGVWTLDVLSWSQRLTGDEDLSPDPGLVGQKLQDIVWHRGRLHLLYEEGGTLSSASDPLQLYPKTLSQVLADDPFEVVNPLLEQARFRFAASFKKKLILFGEGGQAEITSSELLLTSDTAKVTGYGDYEFSPYARPQAINDRLYFVSPRGFTASAVSEIEVNKSSEEGEADDLSVSTPRFLPAGINRVASNASQFQTAYAIAGGTQLYMHLARYAERQRVQNAWLPWSLPPGCILRDLWFDNTRLHVLVSRANELLLLRLDTAPGITDPGSRYVTRLDLRIKASNLDLDYDPGTNRTSGVLPYKLAGEDFDDRFAFMVAAPGGVGGVTSELTGPLPAIEGQLPKIMFLSEDGSFELEGDWTEAPLFAGYRVSQKWVLSEVFYRDPEDRPLRSGRLVLKRILFDLSKTAFLKVTVQVARRRPRVYIFNGGQWDNPLSDYDKVNLTTGVWSVPIDGTSSDCLITVENDSGLPSAVLGWTWEGEVNLKAGRA